MEETRTTKQDWYWAQLTYHVAVSQVSKKEDRAKVKVEDFILKFSNTDPKARMAKSKAAWMMFAFGSPVPPTGN